MKSLGGLRTLRNFAAPFASPLSGGVEMSRWEGTSLIFNCGKNQQIKNEVTNFKEKK
jgi:hypothetical protein